jgi:3-hydroxyacyl-CoA dehydrogenase
MLAIRKAAVIGAGTMGAQIAAHLANAGIPSLLMDVVPAKLLPEEESRGLTLQSPWVRNRLTRTLLERAKKLSPSPFFVPEAASLSRIGNMEDNLAEIAEADWIIEAILERMDLKESVHAKIAGAARADALVTTNTSGLSIGAMTRNLPADYRRRFFGTHFFNPPRYMRLLELVPTPQTDPALLDCFARFAEAALGKGIVRAKDTPGFIANRIGCFDLQHAVLLMQEMGLSIDEVDAITGPAIGRPKSATFRLGDIVGIDLLSQLGRNLREALQNDPDVQVFRPVELIEDLVKRGWWGEKKGQGFYQRVKTDKGREVFALDPGTMEYRPQQKPPFESLMQLAKMSQAGERIRALCSATDKAGLFAWQHLSAVLCYAANRLPEIADDVSAVDNAMKWGYNWELGPFETWDALGPRQTADRLHKEGRRVPDVVGGLLASGNGSFYREHGGQAAFFSLSGGNYKTEAESPKALSLSRLRNKKRVVLTNPGASLIDLDDGIACLEFHSKMNIIGSDQLDMLSRSLEEVRKHFAGLLIGNQGQHFSAGANLRALAEQIERSDWDGIDRLIRDFQRATSTLRQFEKPVIAACHGYALGGGCELSLGCHHIVIAAETNMGLPEVSVGVIPGAHGTKEMLIRSTEQILRAEDADYFSGVKHAWETIGLAKVSTSAAEALKFRYLRPSETTLVMNGAWLIGEARVKALQLGDNYRPNPPRGGIPAIGRSGLAMFKLTLQQMKAGGQISEHDQKLGEKLAWILCGGDLTSLTFVSEQYIMDLEREAFLSLCGEPKTLERIKHTLKTGKPLRN